MTSLRLVTKWPLMWHNQGMHHCHYGPFCVHVEQVHTDLILVTIMQDMIVNNYRLFWPSTNMLFDMHALSL